MQVLLSLDYELFFGTQTGTVDLCLTSPTEAMAEVARRHGIHLSLFVDALYLQRLSEESRRFSRLQRDFDVIRRQLISLRREGHDIQLHLHPHWVDSSYDGEQWQLDTTRYKLHDFPTADVAPMVGSAKKILTDLVGETVFAFRAGGWCLQPFVRIAPALLAHGIWLDSTVFAGGVSTDQDRWFDFSAAPSKKYWRFNDDPNSEDPRGPFVEVPISSMRVGPILFWRMILARKILRQSLHKTFGDGSSLAWGHSYYLKRLFRSSTSVASLDGLKADFLGMALREELAKGGHIFHAMGHPKALSRYSVERLGIFLSSLDSFTGITFQSLKYLKPETRSLTESKERMSHEP